MMMLQFISSNSFYSLSQTHQNISKRTNIDILFYFFFLFFRNSLPSHSPAPQMTNQQGNADMHMHPHQSPISNMPNDNMSGVPGSNNMNVQGKFI